jgi:hypothetical protein
MITRQLTQIAATAAVLPTTKHVNTCLPDCMERQLKPTAKDSMAHLDCIKMKGGAPRTSRSLLHRTSPGAQAAGWLALLLVT